MEGFFATQITSVYFRCSSCFSADQRRCWTLKDSENEEGFVPATNDHARLTAFATQDLLDSEVVCERVNNKSWSVDEIYCVEQVKQLH